jgi:hypothetical protein
VLLQLQQWSLLYGIDWDIQFGTLRGEVTPRGLDAGASRILKLLCAGAGNPADTQVEVLRARLDHKYGDRP